MVTNYDRRTTDPQAPAQKKVCSEDFCQKKMVGCGDVAGGSGG